ncbi:UDP-N-acetylmuramate dehydrogenase [Moraxella nasovis]|uniref:UDP-N-acetylmuramate dehydrogenase n=1 Tax=Moraxella nasovis TaxID=2904121 RepID=UPI001F60D8F0|nr:UDP-N-acetylmuramate dehydrogenase [Moraxella nasovis]UNU72966.1 UDP-N-acetylmuramate dehydrogenase [Moraxella nasovis]
MKLHHDYDLSHANTMALTCTAHTAIELFDTADITPAITYAKLNSLPLLVLSGGSNVILPNKLKACVLLPRFNGIHTISKSDTHVLISAKAGENWHEFVQTCLDNGWYGLENLALIPGLVGACPVQNIGAYGVQVSDFIEKVIAYDLTTGTQCEFKNAKCQFTYRHSLFKDNPNRYLISEVIFKLHTSSDHVQSNYGDLAALSLKLAHQDNRKTIHPKDVFNAVIAIRQSKLPDPKVLANCGSFFQNPIISMAQFTSLKTQHASLPSYLIDDNNVKIPAGWLIDMAGLKGGGIFPILTHRLQALVLTNHTPHIATANDIQKSQDFIIDTVHDKFGVQLVREPVWIDEQGYHA